MKHPLLLALGVSWIDSFHALTAADPSPLTRQPWSQRVVAGHETALIGGSNDPFASYGWEKNGQPLIGLTTTELSVPHALPADSGSYQLIARNNRLEPGEPAIGEMASRTALVEVLMPPQTPGIVDLAFGNPGLSGGEVKALVPSADGGVLAVGDFSKAGRQLLQAIVRFLPDGSPDQDFLTLPGAEGGPIRAAVAHRDGWVVGGGFSTFHGAPRPRLVRLLADGRIDPDFQPPPLPGTSVVRALAVQEVAAEPRLLVGLSAAPWVLRLHADGRQDQAFGTTLATAGLNGPVNAFAVQPDGAVVIGGSFYQSPSSPWPFRRLGRLRIDGRPDTANFPHGPGTGADAEVIVLALTPDGRIIVGGAFNTLHSQKIKYLARLQPDGTLDGGFTPSPPNDAVTALARQADGRLVIAGPFWRIGGVPTGPVARLEADGARDPGWRAASFDDPPAAVAVGPEDRLFFGGDFNQPHRGLVALRGRIPEAAPRVLAVNDPQELTIGMGGSLTVAAEATPGSVFVWRRRDRAEPVAETQTGELIMPLVSGAEAGTYIVEITNPLGSALAGPFEVRASLRPAGARPHGRGLAPGAPHSVPDQGELSLPIPFPPLVAEEIQITLALEHGDTNELAIDLISPGGRVVSLVNAGQPKDFDKGPNFDFTVFADQAEVRINAAPAPRIGTFRPSASPPGLAALAGPHAAGNWRLLVRDLRDDGQIGRLHFAALDIFGPHPLLENAFLAREPFPEAQPELSWRPDTREARLHHWQRIAGPSPVYQWAASLSAWQPLDQSALQRHRREDDQTATAFLRLPDHAPSSHAFLRACWK